jgi:hypothetical protein
MFVLVLLSPSGIHQGYHEAGLAELGMYLSFPPYANWNVYWTLKLLR